ncbi:unnamed protein product [Caenorhabditis sp. 36 PRJEB53466]|nr:unnamed protein product [Caenorhabditis sp. 36 PRJEB53466]
MDLQSLLRECESLPSNGVQIQKTSQKNIGSILKAYETKFKIFHILGISTDGILKKIHFILMSELNIDIEDYYEHDFDSFRMIVAAFFGREHAYEIEKADLEQLEKTADLSRVPERDFLSDCHYPLHTIMVMCFVAHSMQTLLLTHDFGQVKNEKYEKLKDHLQDLACSVINDLYLIDDIGPQKATSALQVDYKEKYPKQDESKESYESYLNRKFGQSKEIMAVAYKAKAMKFLSQKSCLKLMRTRSKCNNRDTSSCEDKIEHKTRPKKSETATNSSQKEGVPAEGSKEKKKRWRLSMRYKLYLHAFFRGLYILAFATMLCRYPTYDDYDTLKVYEYFPFFYVLAVLIAQIFMTFVKVTDYLFYRLGMEGTKWREVKKWTPQLNRYFHFNKLAFYRLFMIMFVIVFESIRFYCFIKKGDGVRDVKFWYSFWTVIPISLELLYCTLFAIATVSSLRFFHFVPSLGFFVHLFKKMWRTVGMFVLLFSTFWFVLAVIHVSISRTFLHTKNTVVYTVVSEGKFEVFGEVRDQDRNGELVNCDQFNRTVLDFLDMHYAEASCLFRSTVLPFLVFVYVFVSGILLVNLLTAQLTKEYEKESEKSRYYTGYLKYEQLSKIESKLYLPPPLSILYVFARLLGLLSGCIYGIVENIEGYAWGVVRPRQESDDGEEEIRRFLRKTPGDVWEGLKEIVNECDRLEANSDNIGKAMKDIDEYLKCRQKKEDERVTTQARSRVQSRSDFAEGNYQTNPVISIDDPIPSDEDSTTLFDEDLKTDIPI